MFISELYDELDKWSEKLAEERENEKSPYQQDKLALVDEAIDNLMQLCDEVIEEAEYKEPEIENMYVFLIAL